jgi:hypothetical protein
LGPGSGASAGYEMCLWKRDKISNLWRMILTLIAGDSGVDPDPYKIFYFDTDLRFGSESGSYPKTRSI